MVLGPEFVEAVRRGDVDWVADWLESLERPEDINDVNAEGKTVLSNDQARVPATGHVPYFPTREILTRKVVLFVDGDVEYVNAQLEVVYHSITAMPEYRAQSFEELRLEESYQEGRDWDNGLQRVCVTCRRSLARHKYSNTQLKKLVGVSRCKECVRVSADEIDIDAIAHTLATLNT